MQPQKMDTRVAALEGKVASLKATIQAMQLKAKENQETLMKMLSKRFENGDVETSTAKVTRKTESSKPELSGIKELHGESFDESHQSVKKVELPMCGASKNEGTTTIGEGRPMIGSVREEVQSRGVETRMSPSSAIALKGKVSREPNNGPPPPPPKLPSSNPPVTIIISVDGVETGTMSKKEETTEIGGERALIGEEDEPNLEVRQGTQSQVAPKPPPKPPNNVSLVTVPPQSEPPEPPDAGLFTATAPLPELSCARQLATTTSLLLRESSWRRKIEELILTKKGTRAKVVLCKLCPTLDLMDLGPFEDTIGFHERVLGSLIQGQLVLGLIQNTSSPHQDLKAQAFGLQFLSPYIQSIDSVYKQGANYATQASTVLMPDASLFVTRVSPFPLAIQFNQMKQSATQVNQAAMGIGGVQQYFLQVVSQIAATIKELNNLGGRTIMVLNLAPVGCYPSFLVELPHDGSGLVEFGCMVCYNNVVVDYNMLKETLKQTRESLSDASVTYVATHFVLLELFQQPTSHGLEYGTKACCAYGGGDYNFDPNIGFHCWELDEVLIPLNLKESDSKLSPTGIGSLISQTVQIFEAGLAAYQQWDPGKRDLVFDDYCTRRIFGGCRYGALENFSVAAAASVLILMSSVSGDLEVFHVWVPYFYGNWKGRMWRKLHGRKSQIVNNKSQFPKLRLEDKSVFQEGGNVRIPNESAGPSGLSISAAQYHSDVAERDGSCV